MNSCNIYPQIVGRPQKKKVLNYGTKNNGITPLLKKNISLKIHIHLIVRIYMKWICVRNKHP